MTVEPSFTPFASAPWLPLPWKFLRPGAEQEDGVDSQKPQMLPQVPPYEPSVV